MEGRRRQKRFVMIPERYNMAGSKFFMMEVPARSSKVETPEWGKCQRWEPHGLLIPV